MCFICEKKRCVYGLLRFYQRPHGRIAVEISTGTSMTIRILERHISVGFLLLIFPLVHSFCSPISSKRCCMLTMNGGVSIFGYSGGIAESIAYKLACTGSSVFATLNEEPFSKLVIDELQRKGTLKISTLWKLNPQQPRDVVILTDDDVSEKIASTNPNRKHAVDPSFASAKSMLGIFRRNSNSDNVGNFGDGQATHAEIESFCSKNGIPFLGLYYNSLVGGVPGLEPVPFLSMPLIEPELHPSVEFQTVVCNESGAPFLSSYQQEICTRDGIAKLAVRCLKRRTLWNQLSGRRSSRGILVHTVAGPPQDSDGWESLFIKLESTSSSSRPERELLKIEFASVPKPQALLTWLCDSWFSQAAAEADASRTFSSIRPVRAVQTGIANVKIAWEEILPDLTVRPVGSLEVQLSGISGTTPPASCQPEGAKTRSNLTITRSSALPLPGDVQLVKSLEDAINKLAEKKQVCRL